MVGKPISCRFASMQTNAMELIFTCRYLDSSEIVYIYSAMYIHGKSRNVEYRHVSFLSMVFIHTNRNLHEMGLLTISLDSVGEHYCRNGTTLKPAIISSANLVLVST